MTSREITASDILAALKDGDPSAFIGEQGEFFVVDGTFNLRVVAERLSEMLETRSASHG